MIETISEYEEQFFTLPVVTVTSLKLCKLVESFSFGGTSCLHYSTLKMEAADTSKTFVTSYQTTSSHIPEYSHLHIHCHGNLKPYRLTTMPVSYPALATKLICVYISVWHI
jgi:hypothetical protein